jgi:hypothetical protein
VPRCVLISYATFTDHEITFDTPLGVLLLVARYTNDVFVTWYETLVADRFAAFVTTEAVFVPLLAHVLVFLHACPEDVSAVVAAWREVCIVTLRTVESVVLSGKRPIDERFLTVATLEAILVPVQFFVRQILGICSNGGLALLAGMCKEILVTLDTIGMFVSQYVAMSRQSNVTLETRKVTRVPVLVHRLRVLTRKYQLVAGGTPRPDRLGVVPLAVDLSVLAAVAQVDEQFLALGARETRRVP